MPNNSNFNLCLVIPWHISERREESEKPIPQKEFPCSNSWIKKLLIQEKTKHIVLGKKSKINFREVC